MTLLAGGGERGEQHAGRWSLAIPGHRSHWELWLGCSRMRAGCTTAMLDMRESIQQQIIERTQP